MPQWALVAGIDKPLISTYSRIRPCMSSSMFASVCVLVCVCVSHCIRVHVCECVYVCATGYLCIVARVGMCLPCTRVCVCTWMCVCMYMYLCACVTFAWLPVCVPVHCRCVVLLVCLRLCFSDTCMRGRDGLSRQME